MVDVSSAGPHSLAPTRYLAGLSARFPGLIYFLQLLVQNLRANAFLWVLIAAFILYVRWQLSFVPGQDGASFGRLLSGFFVVALPLFAIAICIERFVYMAFVVKPEHPIMEYGRVLKSFFCCPRRIANGIPTMVLTFLFASHFGQIKPIIPELNPFQWDETFMWLDRLMHFGYDPWVILQPVLGFWQVTVFFDWMYWAWLLVIYSVWVIAAFANQHSVLRTQFLISFFLIWAVVGSMMSVWFSSVGPVFYAKLGLSPDPFSGLLTYLAAVNEQFPLMAVQTADMLWQGYIGEGGMVKGITAMPSMHNCSSILIAIYGWHINRKLGISLSIFAFIIFLGSVHLAWHYAVDAYLAGIMAGLLWLIAGWIAKWVHSTKASRTYEKLEADGGV